MLTLVPSARVAHIGLYRDPGTRAAVEYYLKVPETMSERQVIVINPLLATGVTACAAVERLKEEGAKDLRFVCILTCPEAIRASSSEKRDSISAIRCGEILPSSLTRRIAAGLCLTALSYRFFGEPLTQKREGMPKTRVILQNNHRFDLLCWHGVRQRDSKRPTGEPPPAFLLFGRRVVRDARPGPRSSP
eukprot:gene36541-49231_t